MNSLLCLTCMLFIQEEGKLTKAFNQQDDFQDIYSDAWTNETLDKFIIKLRLKF